MRPETKQLLKNISIGLGVFTLIGCLLYGVWHGTRISVLTIDEVLVSGGETISHSAVASDVSALLEGEYMRFVPRRFAWTYPETEILATLNQIDRVKDPQISRDGRTLFITLAEYKPVALWCDATSTTTCAFIDSDGYAFALAPQLTGGAFVRYVQVGQPVATGEGFAQHDDFALLRELVTLLGQSDWPVAAIELDQARDAFVYLAGGGELKVSLLLMPVDTIDNLQTVLSTEQYRHLVPNNFVYIDLRFGNKVFVSEFGVPVVESAVVAEGGADEAARLENPAIETATSSDAAALD